MPLVGFLSGLLVACAGEYFSVYYGTVANWAIGTWIGSCVLGLVAAGIALGRAERLWGITLFGFLVNAPLPLLFLRWYLDPVLPF